MSIRTIVLISCLGFLTSCCNMRTTDPSYQYGCQQNSCVTTQCPMNCESNSDSCDSCTNSCCRRDDSHDYTNCFNNIGCNDFKNMNNCCN